MHFNVCRLVGSDVSFADTSSQVEGPLNKGVVNIHMTKKPSDMEFEYRILALDVQGHERLYVENTDDKGPRQGGVKMLGVKWR